MESFRLVACPECGEEFRIEITKICPECKAVYPKLLEDEIQDGSKKKKSKTGGLAFPTKQVSIEEQLAAIQHLLYKIHRNVAFFAWVLWLSLLIGFLWAIDYF